MGKRVLALVKKEFLAIFKDKKSRLTVIVPPLVQLMVFSYAATYDLGEVPYAVFNEDRGTLSRDFIARFEGSPNFKQVAVVERIDEIRDLIDRRQILLAIHIRSDFSKQILSGDTAGVQLALDGRNSNTAMIALNYARAIITDFNRRLISEKGEQSLPAELVVRAWYNQNLVSRWFIVPGILGVMTLLVTMLVTALSVAREREQGTFDQLLVTPLRPLEILMGKSIPGLAIGLFEGSACLVVALVWFEVPFRGHLLFLYAGLFLFLISAVGVGLMISSLAVTQQQGLLGAFLFMVPAVILSGFTTPIENMPAIVQKITLANPLRHFMVVLRGAFLEDAPASVFLNEFWPMALIGLVTLATASWLFRHRVN